MITLSSRWEQLRCDFMSYDGRPVRAKVLSDRQAPPPPLLVLTAVIRHTRQHLIDYVCVRDAQQRVDGSRRKPCDAFACQQQQCDMTENRTKRLQQQISAVCQPEKSLFV